MERGSINMFDLKISTNNGIKKSNFFSHQKIRSFSRENIMFLLCNNKYDISSLFDWMLIRFSMEEIFLSIWRTLVNSNFEHFLLSFSYIGFTFFNDPVPGNFNLNFLSLINIF